MSSPLSRCIGIAAALALASTFTAAEILSTITSRSQMNGMSHARRWRLDGIARGDLAVCRWGIGAGYGQPVCGAWGISPFPATSARPVAIWLAATVLSGVVQQVRPAPTGDDKPFRVR